MGESEVSANIGLHRAECHGTRCGLRKRIWIRNTIAESEGTAMAFGEALSLISNKTTDRLYGKLVGVDDFHSHFRWRGIKQFVNFAARRTLEVGAGTGVMTFEVAKRLPKDASIIASEFDNQKVDIGKEIAKRGGFTNVEFVEKDLRNLGLGEKFNQVLAIDVIEHIDNDILALKEINGVLESDGLLVISVPTPLYPKYFGRRFADMIGHVRDGYFIEDLTEKLHSTGFTVLRYQYYTRFWASLFCSLFYRIQIPLIPRIKRLLLPILKYLALFLDIFSTARHSTSLAVLAQKTS